MSTNTIDIHDFTTIDRIELLRMLWQHQKVASFFTSSGIPSPPFSNEDAFEAVTKGYIDYFCGRCIKTDLSRDVINPYSYDRDAGAGKFVQIIDEIKKQRTK